jgi:ankyrin repeat protein
MEVDKTRFLLARLYVDALLDKRTKSRVRSTLDALSIGSQTLEKAYEDAIKRLESQLPEDTALAKRVISWIVYAERSFHMTELRCALAVEFGATSFDPDNVLDTEDIVSVCAGLVTVEKKSNIIRLVHYTAQEYFDRIRCDWIPHGHLDITRTCLTYLSFETFRDGSCSDRLEYGDRMNAYPFLQYAARHWGRHARSVQDAVFDLVCATLLDQGRLSSTSQVLYSRIWFYSTFPRVNILHMLAYFGLHILAERLLAQCGDKSEYWVTQRNEKLETCLYIAADQGHDAMVELLLDKGAEVNEEVGKFGSVLQVAVHEGNLSTVKLLLDNGADINAKDQRHTDETTALHRACRVGDSEMVYLLLVYGADMTIENINGQTPLQLAIERSSYEVVKLLLGEGAINLAHNNTNIDVDAHNRNLLHLSAQSGELNTYWLIAEQGIDPLLRDAKGDNTLSYAASSGSLQVFEAALSMAPVCALQKGHWSPLHWACKGGNGEIVKRLLQSGFQGHSVTLSLPKDRWSPADIAIHHGHLSMLEDLSDSCKAALGPIEKPGRVPGIHRRNILCDGCLMVSCPVKSFVFY